ncbi:MAG: hypothetical protein Q9209_004611 [Squamulea sp. 1 TL-2023]
MPGLPDRSRASNKALLEEPEGDPSGGLRPAPHPLAYDRLIRRFQTAAEREADGKKKGYSGILEADLWRSEAKIDAQAKYGKNDQTMNYTRGANGETVAEEKDEVPASKEEGKHQWRKQVELRFLNGDDADFDYRLVDENDQYDGLEEAQDIEDQWFEEEEEGFTPEGPGSVLQGQTGVQDF